MALISEDSFGKSANGLFMAKTYIHIGYPKNASTTLQTDIFPKIDGIKYLGRIYHPTRHHISEELTEAINSISMLDSIAFSEKDIMDKIKRTICGIQLDNDKILISCEAFSANMADRGVIAKRLYKIFPDARILVVIRNQMDILQSMYAFLVEQQGKNMNLSFGQPSVQSFERWIIEQEKFFCRSFISTLKYFEFISVYQDLFGKENVSVLLFEDLVRNPIGFFDKLANYLGVDSSNFQSSNLPQRKKRSTRRKLFYFKLRYSLPDISFSQKLPSFVVRSWHRFLNNGKVYREKTVLPPQLQGWLNEMFRQSNRKLQKELDTDLSKYGYII